MKNQKFILIISLVFFSFIEGNYLQAACIVPTIAQTSTAPTIDGNIDAAWTTAPAQSIAKIVLGTPANNPAGQWRAMFDGTNFYFLIEVNDPDRRINGSWDGDAVELYIRNSAPAKQQIGFAYQTNTTPTRYGDYTGGTSFMRDVATTYNGTSGGYILEVSIPKTAMGFGAYTAGNSIFMEIAINETNNSGGTNRASQLVWNNTASDHYNSYANYTSVPLADCGPSVPAISVSVTPATATLYPGYGIDLTETVYPLDANNKAVTWTSSNPAVATVSSTGVVTAVSNGTATITVTTVDGGHTATSEITVVAAPVASCSAPIVITTNTTPPLIDDVIDAIWATAPSKSLNVQMSGTPTNNPAGQWRALHDANNLYFLIEITDANRTANGSWNGDAVEIFIDGLGNGGSAGYADADDTSYGYSYSPTNPVPYNSAASTNYKMHDVTGGYVLEVAIPWSTIGVTQATAITNGIKFDVVNNQANGGARIGQMASFVNNDAIWNTPNLLGATSYIGLDCFNMSLTGSNNGDKICIGDPVILTATHSLSGTDYTWYKKEDGSSTWTLIATTTSNTYHVLPALSTEYKVEYAGESSNFYYVSAAICCSDEVPPVVLYQENFGTLPSNCARANTTVVPASANMQYADNNTPSLFVNDGYYAVVANAGCDAHGNNGAGNTWFLTGEDHTPGDTNGGMLLVNNSATAATIFSVTIPNPCPNTTLEFTSWFANACRVAGDCGLPVNLTFKVFGETAGAWGEVPNSTIETGNLGHVSPLTWFQRGTTFSSGTYDNLRVEITNNGDPGQGNDALIDDILFTACSPRINLYTDPSIFQTDTLLCEDGLVTLTPISAHNLNEFFTPLHFLLQQSTDSISWTNVLPVISGNPNPSWSVNTDTLTSDTTYYRVIVGNDEATVLSIADSTYVPGTGCVLYTMTNVTYIAKPAFVIGTEDTKTVCEGSSVYLQGITDGVEWQWEDASGNVIKPRSSNVADKTYYFSATQDTVFYFRAFDAFGCSKRQKFNVNIVLLPTYTFVQDDAVCLGESITLTLTLTGTPPFSFVFSDGTTDEIITNVQTNVWTRTVAPTSLTNYTIRNVKDLFCAAAD